MHLANGYEIVDAIDTRHLGNGHIGCALSHRLAITMAIERGWDEVLVLEDDAVPVLRRAGALSVLPRTPRDAELVYLGGFRQRDYRCEPCGVEGLARVRGGLTTTHALVYRRPVFDAVLAYVPPTVERIEEAWGRGDPRSYGRAIDREYARWQKDPARAIYAVDPPWPFGGNWSHAEPALAPGPVRLNHNVTPLPMKMLVSRYHQFMVPPVPGNAREEILRAVALTEPTVARRLARGEALDDAMGDLPNERWWLDPRRAHKPCYDHFCKFFVWRDPLDRLRSLYSQFARADQKYPRWRGMMKDGLLRPPMLEQYFEPLVEAEIALRASSLIDVRVRPQHQTFRSAPVDVIVPLSRLNDFLRERFGLTLPLAEPTAAALSPRLETTLQRLVTRHYEGDFEMLNAGVPIYGGAVTATEPFRSPSL
jgi:hypothetical protein